MNTGEALLQTLAGRGVVLMADAGKLRYRAPAGTLTPDLRRQLEAHKAALVALLSAQQVSLFDTSAPDLGAAAIVKQRETTGQTLARGAVIQPKTAKQTPGQNLREPVKQVKTGGAGALVAGSGQAVTQDAAPTARPTYGQDFARARLTWP